MSPSQSNKIFGWYLFLLLLAITIVAVGLAGGLKQPEWDNTLLAVGVLGMLVIGAAFPIAMLQIRSMRRSPNTTSTDVPTNQNATSTDTAHLSQQRMENALIEIRDIATLSDEAKRVLFKKRERIILRALVDQAIAARHFAGGESLCDAMENALGYTEVANECRDRINTARSEARHGEAEQSLAQFDACLERLDWGGAYQEAATIRRVYPDISMASQLDERIIEARENHRQHLEDSFHHAAANDDIETAMSVLKELDRYMTRDEAARLQDEAQAIISAYRDRLGSSFQMAVQEKRWADAAQFGNIIMEEYPNSKMAEEVRSMIDVIRTRATQAALSQ